MKIISFFLLSLSLNATIEIIDKPIVFNKKRIILSKEYIQEHYGMEVDNLQIQARMIVIHWTATNDLNCSMQRFKNPTLPSDRPLIKQASPLNVSTHFVVDRNGTIYRLMDEKMMARHVIGLNYCSIGIENVGGANNIDNLTPDQFKANIQLIKYLKKKYPKIDYLIGHHEYTDFVNSPLWLEKDDNYRTLKYDPGNEFMSKLRKYFPEFKVPKQGKI